MKRVWISFVAYMSVQVEVDDQITKLDDLPEDVLDEAWGELYDKRQNAEWSLDESEQELEEV